MTVPWNGRLLNDDHTHVSIVKPNGTGIATGRGLTAEEVAELAELEQRRVPIGFGAPPAKAKRKRKAKP